MKNRKTKGGRLAEGLIVYITILAIGILTLAAGIVLVSLTPVAWAWVMYVGIAIISVTVIHFISRRVNMLWVLRAMYIVLYIIAAVLAALTVAVMIQGSVDGWHLISVIFFVLLGVIVFVCAQIVRTVYVRKRDY